MKKLMGSLLVALAFAVALASVQPEPAQATKAPKCGKGSVTGKACTSRCDCMGVYWVPDGVCSAGGWPPPYEHCVCLSIMGAEGVEVSEGPGTVVALEKTDGFYNTIKLKQTTTEEIVPDAAELAKLARGQRKYADSVARVSDSVNAAAEYERLNNVVRTGLVATPKN